MTETLCVEGIQLATRDIQVWQKSPSIQYKSDSLSPQFDLSGVLA